MSDNRYVIRKAPGDKTASAIECGSMHVKVIGAPNAVAKTLKILRSEGLSIQQEEQLSALRNDPNNWGNGLNAQGKLRVRKDKIPEWMSQH